MKIGVNRKVDPDFVFLLTGGHCYDALLQSYSLPGIKCRFICVYM